MAQISCVTAVWMLWLSAFPCFAGKGGGTFHLSQEIRVAYGHVMNLRLGEAGCLLQEIAITEPDNLMAHYVADYIDFLEVMIAGTPDAYHETRTQRDTRMRLITLGDASSPYYLFVQAEIYFHRALQRAQFGEEFAAAADLNQAFKLLKRNQRRFPEFTPNHKTLGILKAAFSTIPEEYQWAIELLSSMEGSVAEGMQDLEVALRDREQLTYRETQLFTLLALMQFRNAPDEALARAGEWNIRATDGPLECMTLAHIAMKGGKNDLAAQWLGERCEAGDVEVLPHLALMYGTARLHRLDPDADVPLSDFLTRYHGESYRKATLMKLAWHALVNGDQAGYRRFMERCREEGGEVLEGDRYAMRQAGLAELPSADLMKARLLFDGGYPLKALEILEDVVFDEITDGEQRLEYHYRLGRVYNELGREYDALFSYKMAIASNADSPRYYGCAAALYAGLLYENKGEVANADQYFRICLGMTPEEYRTGLHQMAKAGLSRIKGSGRQTEE